MYSVLIHTAVELARAGFASGCNLYSAPSTIAHSARSDLPAVCNPPLQIHIADGFKQCLTTPDEQFRLLQCVTLGNLIQNRSAFFQWQGPNILRLIVQQ